MAKKLVLCLMVLLAAFSFSIGSGCSNTNNNKYKPGTEYSLNGFDNLDDLYDVKLVNLEYSTEAKLDINKDVAYIKQGAGSLMFNVIHHVWPEIYTVIGNTAAPDMDVSDIRNVSVWIYNDGEESVLASLNVCQDDLTHLLSEDFEIPAKSWKECVMDVNAVVTKYAKNNITGFSIQFKTETEQKFYVDDLAVEFGSQFSAEDNANVVKIEEVISDISSMPTTITADDEEQISAIYNKYNSIPDLYKSAVNNYSKLQLAMTDMTVVRNSVEEKKETADISRPAFYFDKFYGMSHLSTSYGTKVNFAYSTDIKYGNESGSTVIKFLGDVWNYIDFANTVSLKNYDYVEFALYNDGLEKAVWLNNNSLGWTNRTQVKTNEWVRLQIPVSALNDSGAQLIITTSVDMGTASKTDGNVYISQIRAFKLVEKNMYVPALNEQTPFTSTAANIAVNNDKINVTATLGGDILLTLNKEVEELNVAQNAIFSLKTTQAATLLLLNENGTAISGGSISLAEGWNTVILDSKKYEQTKAIRVNAEVNQQFELTNFYVILGTDEQGMRLILEKDYLPEETEWTVEDLPQAINYMLIYNDAQLTGLKNQFVKVAQSVDATIYEKQIAEYNEIVALLESRKETIKDLMEELIDSIDLNDEDVEKRYLLESVYSKYLETAMLEDLSSNYTDKAVEILAQLEYLPYRLLDVSSSADRAKIEMYANFFPWSGKIYAVEDQEYKTVMGVVANEFRNQANGNSHDNVELKYDLTNLPDGYDYLSFKIYNPAKGRQLYFITYGWGATVKKFNLAPDKWNEITISVLDYQSAGYMLLTSMSYTTTPNTLKFTDFYLYNEKYVVNQINQLPEVDQITLDDSTKISAIRENYEKLSSSYKGKVDNISKLEDCEAKLVYLSIQALPANSDLAIIDYTKIAAAKQVYNALSQRAKNLVTNYQTLTELETAYNSKFVIVDGMESAQNYSVHNDAYGNGACTTLGVGTDAEKGNYLSAYISGALHEHLAIKYTIDGLQDKLATCTKVQFFVYNGNASNKTFMCNFGGSLKPNYATLTAGEWTKIEVSTSDFISGTYFGILEVNKGFDPCEYKFSIIGGETDKGKETEVISLINEISAASELTFKDFSKITAARAAYDKLSAATKNAVTNYELLTAAETAFAQNFKIVEPMNGSSIFSLHSGSYTELSEATLSYGNDQTYGNYLSMRYIAKMTGSSGHAVIKMTFDNIDLSDCDKFYLYVYNGGTSDRRCLTNIGGTLNTNYKTLVAGEWTLVEFNAADFISGKYVGILEAQANTEYKFSMVWATKVNA